MNFFAQILAVVTLSVSFSNVANGQYQSINLGIAASDLMGELKVNNSDFSNIGMDYSLNLMHTFYNERWRFFLEGSFNNGEQKRIYNNGAYNVALYSKYQAYSALGGVQFVLSGNVNSYKSFTGMFAPYIGVGVGTSFANSSIVDTFGITLNNFNIVNEVITPIIEGQLGADITLSKRVRAGLCAKLRTSFTDYLDGIMGITNKDDFYLRVGMTLTYDISRNKRNF